MVRRMPRPAKLSEEMPGWGGICARQWKSRKRVEGGKVGNGRWKGKGKSWRLGSVKPGAGGKNTDASVINSTRSLP